MISVKNNYSFWPVNLMLLETSIKKTVVITLLNLKASVKTSFKVETFARNL